jgi:hypothetical protein
MADGRKTFPAAVWGGNKGSSGRSRGGCHQDSEGNLAGPNEWGTWTFP